MVGNYRPAHLSPSSLSTYAWCPQTYYDRYVAKQPEPPSYERSFGSAVHKGLEAHYRNEDYEMAFLRCWREAVEECRQAGIAVPQFLTERGLDLIEMVRQLGLQGEPEKWASVIPDGFKIPIIGVVDLWTENHIWDFKTTGYGWSQKKADLQVFQPAIYSQAHADTFSSIPKFTFVVLPRNGGPVQLVDGTRTGQQILDAFTRAKEIHELIEAQQWACQCGKHQENAA